MKNKYLVNVYVPKLLESYDIYIPANERVSRVLELIIKIVYELSDSSFNLDETHYILEVETSKIYEPNQIIRETTIKNGSKIILF